MVDSPVPIEIETHLLTFLIADNTQPMIRPNRGPVRKMRIYNDKHIFETISPFLTTLRKFQWS